MIYLDNAATTFQNRSVLLMQLRNLCKNMVETPGAVDIIFPTLPQKKY